MKRNEGTLDRIIRGIAAVAAVIVAAAIGFGTVAGVILLVVAAILAVTAVTGFCPLYRVFGLSTYRPTPAAAPAREQIRVH